MSPALRTTRYGTLVQLGLVVPDLGAAIDAWCARGVGPFFEMTRVPLRESIYRGTPVTVEMSVAIAYSGATQIELIAVHGEAENTYRAFLRERSAGGLHHLGFVVDDYERVLADARARDVAIEQEMTSAIGSRYAYLDREPTTGALVEVLEAHPMQLRVFDYVRKASESWDGSEPRRRLG